MVFHSATLVVCGVFLLGLAATGEIFRRGGAEWGYVAEVSLIFGGSWSVAVLLTSGSARSRIRSMLVDNFFSQRYDYRREWMRCIDTLPRRRPYQPAGARDPCGRGSGRQPCRRPVRARARRRSPSNGPARGTCRPRPSRFRPATRWSPNSATATGSSSSIEQRRSPNGSANCHAPGSPCRSITTAQLIGFVVLARSRAQFKLDREVFDLLRIIGREVASRVAEQLAAQVLSQTQQLREYSQRFAFVIHDIKNVSGQLSMLLTNAEVHADNPEFQRDMLATVRASVGKITRLLTRLQADRQERSHALITPVQRLKDIVETTSQIIGAPVALSDDGDNAGVAIDPESFDAVVQHLLNNAIEASGKSSPVHVEYATRR